MRDRGGLSWIQEISTKFVKVAKETEKEKRARRKRRIGLEKKNRVSLGSTARASQFNYYILVRQFPRSKIVAKTCRRFRFPVDKLICCPVEITAERVSTRDNGFTGTGT